MVQLLKIMKSMLMFHSGTQNLVTKASKMFMKCKKWMLTLSLMFEKKNVLFLIKFGSIFDNILKILTFLANGILENLHKVGFPRAPPPSVFMYL